MRGCRMAERHYARKATAWSGCILVRDNGRVGGADDVVDVALGDGATIAHVGDALAGSTTLGDPLTGFLLSSRDELA